MGYQWISWVIPQQDLLTTPIYGMASCSGLFLKHPQQLFKAAAFVIGSPLRGTCVAGKGVNSQKRHWYPFVTTTRVTLHHICYVYIYIYYIYYVYIYIYTHWPGKLIWQRQDHIDYERLYLAFHISVLYPTSYCIISKTDLQDLERTSDWKIVGIWIQKHALYTWGENSYPLNRECILHSQFMYISMRICVQVLKRMDAHQKLFLNSLE